MNTLAVRLQRALLPTTALLVLAGGPTARAEPSARATAGHGASTSTIALSASDPAESLASRGMNEHSRSEEHILPGWQFGAIGTFSATFASEEETDVEGGVGAMIDHFLVDNVLEVGGSVRLLRGQHTSVSFEVLFDVPYHLSPFWEVYAGVGGVAVVGIDAENRYGGAAAVGIHAWFNHRYGIVAEVGYALLSGDELGHEVGISIGPLIEL